MSNYFGTFPLDRPANAQMMEAVGFNPSEPVPEKAAKPKPKSRSKSKDAFASDQASVRSTSTFGSTVGLLKKKAGFSSSSSSSRKGKSKDTTDAHTSAKEASKALRNQVNTV